MLDLESQEFEGIFSRPGLLMRLSNESKRYWLPNGYRTNFEFKTTYLLKINLLGNDLRRNLLQCLSYVFLILLYERMQPALVSICCFPQQFLQAFAECLIWCRQFTRKAKIKMLVKFRHEFIKAINVNEMNSVVFR